MSSAFWVDIDEMNAEQRQAAEAHLDKSFLIRGAAGSGKTNLLLLRAGWLLKKNQSNYKILVFTKSLREFVRTGCEQYDVDPATVVTQIGFFREVLAEYGDEYEDGDEESFEAVRLQLAGKLKSLIDQKKISEKYIPTILVDEAQDYTETELLVFKGICKNLILAADHRQSIYHVKHSDNFLENLVDGNTINLKYHYRSGRQLCKVADAILSDDSVYERVLDTCEYDESTRPSSVTSVPCADVSAQHQAIIASLLNQTALYPGERLGVLFPKREQADDFKEYFASHFDGDPANIWIDTLHSSKGWEFRAVHIAGCEKLSRMGSIQKRLIYTGILRGRTSVHVYYAGKIPGYLNDALASLSPPVAAPSLADIFGAKKC